MTDPRNDRPEPDEAPEAVERLAELERAFGADPDSEVFVDLARALLGLGRAHRAYKVLKRGLASHPEHRAGRLLMGEALLARGRLRKCMREMARLLNDDPDEPGALRLLGRALIEDGQHEEAVVVLRRAAERHPEDREIGQLFDRARDARREAPISQDIGVREPDGRITDLQAARVPPKPGFTGYIRVVALEEELADAPPDKGASGVIIDERYFEELMEAGGSAEDDGEGPTAAFDPDPAMFEPIHPDDAGDHTGQIRWPVPPEEPAAPAASSSNDTGPPPTPAEAFGRPQHPGTGGATREAMSPAVGEAGSEGGRSPFARPGTDPSLDERAEPEGPVTAVAAVDRVRPPTAPVPPPVPVQASPAPTVAPSPEPADATPTPPGLDAGVADAPSLTSLSDDDLDISVPLPAEIAAEIAEATSAEEARPEIDRGWLEVELPSFEGLGGRASVSGTGPLPETEATVPPETVEPQSALPAPADQAADEPAAESASFSTPDPTAAHDAIPLGAPDAARFDPKAFALDLPRFDFEAEPTAAQPEPTSPPEPTPPIEPTPPAWAQLDAARDARPDAFGDPAEPVDELEAESLALEAIEALDERASLEAHIDDVEDSVPSAPDPSPFTRPRESVEPAQSLIPEGPVDPDLGRDSLFVTPPGRRVELDESGEMPAEPTRADPHAASPGPLAEPPRPSFDPPSVEEPSIQDLEEESADGEGPSTVHLPGRKRGAQSLSPAGNSLSGGAVSAPPRGVEPPAEPREVPAPAPAIPAGVRVARPIPEHEDDQQAAVLEPRPSPAPSAPPPTPPQEPAESGPAAEPVNLLDIPLDPSEFDDGPRPAPRADRPVPPDMTGGPAPRPVPEDMRDAAPPVPSPPRRAAADQPAGRPAGERPPRGPNPARAGASEPPPSPQPPSPQPPSQQPPSPPPRRAPAPGPDRAVAPPPPEGQTPAPDYQGEFSSFFDGGHSQLSGSMSDVVGNLVAEHRASTQGEEPTEPPAGVPVRRDAPAERRGGGVLRAALLGGVTVLALGIIGVTWRYVSAHEGVAGPVAEARAAILDGNYASRVDATTALAAADTAPGPLASLGNAVARLFGRQGITGARAEARALRARVLAERVVQFRDLGQAGPAAEAAEAAAAARPQDADTRVAQALLQIHEGEPEAAEQQLKAALAATPADESLRYAAGLAAERAGRREVAKEHYRAALQANPGHIAAHAALARIKAVGGDGAGAYEAYANLLSTLGAEHVDSRIDQARLQIDIGKRSEEAVGTLKEMLAGGSTNLSEHQRARLHEGIGEFYASGEDWNAARAAFQAAVDAAPLDPAFVAGLVRLNLRERKIDEAEALLEKSPHTAETADMHRQLRAEARLLRGDAEGALAHLKEVEREGARVLLLKGRALLELGRADEAEKALDVARGLDRGLTDIQVYSALADLAQGRPAKRELSELRASRPGERLQDRGLPFRAYAKALLAERDRREATAQLEAALAADKRDFRARYDLCQLNASRLRARDALDECIKALALNPWFIPAAAAAAEIAEAHQDWNAVADVLEPALAGGAGADPAAFRRLARGLVKLKKLDEAEKLLAEDGPLQHEASRRYVKGLVAHARGHYREAGKALAAAVEQLPEEPWVLRARADALMRAGEPEEAGAWYRRALKAGGGAEAALGAAKAWLSLEGEWRNALSSARVAVREAKRGLSHPRVRAEAIAVQGEAWSRSGSRRGLRKARSLLRQSLKIERDLPTALLALGRVDEATRRYEDAAGQYARATQVDPDNAEAWYMLGMVLRRVGDRRDAREALDSAKKLDPEGRWGILADQAIRRRR